MKGFLKTHTLPNSVAIGFWKIISISISYPSQRVVIYLGGYASEAAYDAQPTKNIVAPDCGCDEPDFTTHFAAAALSPVNKEPERNAYDYLQTLSAFVITGDDTVDFTTGVTEVP